MFVDGWQLRRIFNRQAVIKSTLVATQSDGVVCSCYCTISWVWKFFRLHRNSARIKGEIFFIKFSNHLVVFERNQTNDRISCSTQWCRSDSICNHEVFRLNIEDRSAVDCKMNKKWLKCNLLTMAESTSAISTIACQVWLLAYLILPQYPCRWTIDNDITSKLEAIQHASWGWFFELFWKSKSNHCDFGVPLGKLILLDFSPTFFLPH